MVSVFSFASLCICVLLFSAARRWGAVPVLTRVGYGKSGSMSAEGWRKGFAGNFLLEAFMLLSSRGTGYLSRCEWDRAVAGRRRAALATSYLLSPELNLTQTEGGAAWAAINVSAVLELARTARRRQKRLRRPSYIFLLSSLSAFMCG